MKPEHTDNTLFERIREGKVEAYNTLYGMYYAPLCVFASRYLADQEACRDCVHDIFVKLWSDRHRLPTVSSVKYYLLAAVRNGCLNYLRRTRLAETYEQRILRKYDPYCESDLYSLEEMEELTRKAIAKLPPLLYETFTLSRVEDMSYKEIAEKQGISVKTVEARISRSLVILRVELAELFSICFFLFLLK